MAEVMDKYVHPGPTDGWNPYDEYDCRSETETLERRLRSFNDAIAKRQGELKDEAPEGVPNATDSD